MKKIPYILAAAFLTLSGVSFAHAQNVSAGLDVASSTSTEEASMSTSTTPATSTLPAEPIAATSTEATSSPEKPVEETPTPAPTQKPKPKPLPKPTPVVTAPESTTTATSSEFMPLAPSITLPGNIYRNAAHPPLSEETTLALLAFAFLCAVLGTGMIEKTRLERMGAGIANIFSPLRSPLRPRAGRQ
jgi:outer membrane biosynthesis protein TonB